MTNDLTHITHLEFDDLLINQNELQQKNSSLDNPNQFFDFALNNKISDLSFMEENAQLNEISTNLRNLPEKIELSDLFDVSQLPYLPDFPDLLTLNPLQLIQPAIDALQIFGDAIAGGAQKLDFDNLLSLLVEVLGDSHAAVAKGVGVVSDTWIAATAKQNLLNRVNDTEKYSNDRKMDSQKIKDNSTQATEKIAEGRQKLLNAITEFLENNGRAISAALANQNPLFLMGVMINALELLQEVKEIIETTRGELKSLAEILTGSVIDDKTLGEISNNMALGVSATAKGLDAVTPLVKSGFKLGTQLITTPGKVYDGVKTGASQGMNRVLTDVSKNFDMLNQAVKDVKKDNKTKNIINNSPAANKNINSTVIPMATMGNNIPASFTDKIKPRHLENSSLKLSSAGGGIVSSGKPIGISGNITSSTSSHKSTLKPGMAGVFSSKADNIKGITGSATANKGYTPLVPLAGSGAGSSQTSSQMYKSADYLITKENGEKLVQVYYSLSPEVVGETECKDSDVKPNTKSSK